jgi:cytidine deaminase
MIDKLKELLNNSRSDYFHYCVSAAIVTTDNRVFYGVNVETSSPQAGICAERNALYNAITNGIKEHDIKEIHVMSKNGVFPCFICRQALFDYCNSDVIVYAHSINDDVKSAAIEELCTYAFGRSDL